MGEDGDSGISFVFRELLKQIIREIDFQEKVICGIGKAAGGGGVAVAIWDVGFDVEDRGSIHQISTGYMENGAILRLLDTQQFHTGQAQIIGAEGRTSGEDTHSGIAAKSWGTDGGRPVLTDSLGELPDQPQVGKTFDTPEGIRVSEFRFKNDDGAKFFNKAALTGDSEFCRKIASHFCDRVDRDIIHQALTFRKQKVTAKISARESEMAAPVEAPQ